MNNIKITTLYSKDERQQIIYTNIDCKFMKVTEYKICYIET